jgi:hypothetical protein
MHAPAVEINMATFTGTESGRCVFSLEETKSATQAQTKFRTQYRNEPRVGPQFTSNDTVEQIRESFVPSPRK